MKKTKNSKWVALATAWYLIIAVFIDADMAAANVKFIPEVWLGAEYNDNVEYANNDSTRTDDIIGTAGAAMNLVSKGARSDLDASVSYEALQYQDNTDLNSDVKRVRLKGDLDATERLKFDAYARFLEDTTFDSELRETGLVFDLEDRRRYDVEGGLEYDISERLSFEVELDYLFIQYEDEGIDRDNKYLGLALRRRLANDVDTLSILPSVSYQTSYDRVFLSDEPETPDGGVLVDSRNPETNAIQYGLQLGWTRELSETWKMIINIGARYTETEIDQVEQDGAWNGFGAFYFYRSGQRLSTSLSYNRTENFDFEGNLREADIFGIFLSYLVTQKFNIELNCTGVNSNVEPDAPGSDSQYLEVIPSLKYRLTEDFTLRFAYTYELSRILEEDGVDRYRNRVWVELNYAFNKLF